MNISTLNSNYNIYNNLSFKSHSPEVRKADHIMRKAQNTFPMVSTTRVATFYDLLGKPRPKRDKLDKIQDEIFMMRDEAQFKQKWEDYACNPHLAHIEEIEKRKIGNCLEGAITSAAGLSANGYKSDVVSLYVHHSFINKKTGRVEYKEGAYLDHAFTVTDMGTGIKEKDRQIVLDPWCGLCGKWSEISPKYHAIFENDVQLQQFKTRNREEFEDRLRIEFSPYDISDYEERVGFSYRSISLGMEDREQIKNAFKQKYPKLLLNG